MMQVEGVQYTSSKNMMRQRLYQVNSDVKWGHRFAPCVTRPQNSPDNRPMVTWNCFHKILPLASEESKSVGPFSSPLPFPQALCFQDSGNTIQQGYVF
jgi:hypothetical protein